MNNINNINYKIIEDIYINLFQKYDKKEYIDDNIFNSLVPDYIENNKQGFKNPNSNNYKNFVLNLVYQKTNDIQYIYKPSLLILFKLINLFINDDCNDKFIWLYNKTLHKIQYFDPNYYFQNTSGSSIYEFYNCNLPLEYFYEICWRMFYIEHETYYLLNGELEWMDNNLNLSDNKFNNLKFNVFLGVLEQFKISSQSKRFDGFNNLVDLANPPNSNSIKFSIYIGVYIGNMILNNSVHSNNIFTNINYDDSNINKFFSLLTLLDYKTFVTIFDYIDELSNDIFINTNNNDINEIFDTNNNFIKSSYDYKLKNNYLDENINKNKIKLDQYMIKVYGGGENDTNIKIPINPLNKIAKYIYYIKQNII